MRNSEEHSRLKCLLTDTITLLCKNGLTYNEEFSVDALIGITLDKEEVVLVSIKEIIKNATGRDLSSDEEFHSDSLSQQQQPLSQNNTTHEQPISQKHSSPRKRHRRKRPKETFKKIFNVSDSESDIENDYMHIPVEKAQHSPRKKPLIIQPEETGQEKHDNIHLGTKREIELEAEVMHGGGTLKQDADLDSRINSARLNLDDELNDTGLFASSTGKTEQQSNSVQSVVTVTPITGIIRSLPPSSNKSQLNESNSAKTTEEIVTPSQVIDFIRNLPPASNMSHNSTTARTKEETVPPNQTNFQKNLDDILSGMAVPDPETGKYLCPICAGQFSERGNFKQHMQGAHGMGRKYTCVCNAQFSWKQSFNRHKAKCLVYSQYYNEMLQGMGTEVQP